MNQTKVSVEVRRRDGTRLTSFSIDPWESMLELKNALHRTGCTGLTVQEMCLTLGEPLKLGELSCNPLGEQIPEPQGVPNHAPQEEVLVQAKADMSVWELRGSPQWDKISIRLAVGAWLTPAFQLSRRYRQSPCGEMEFLVYAPVPGDGRRYAALWVEGCHRAGQVKGRLLEWLGIPAQDTEQYVLRSGREALPNDQTLGKCKVQVESLLWLEPAHRPGLIPVKVSGLWWEDTVKIEVHPDDTEIELKRRIQDALTWQPRLKCKFGKKKAESRRETLNYWFLESCFFTMYLVSAPSELLYRNKTLRESGVKANKEICIGPIPNFVGIYEASISDVVIYVDPEVLQSSQSNSKLGGRWNRFLLRIRSWFKRTK